MSSNNIVLNRFFTQYVFNDLVANHTNSTYCTVVKRYLKDEQGKSNCEVISQIYKWCGIKKVDSLFSRIP